MGAFSAGTDSAVEVTVFSTLTRRLNGTSGHVYLSQIDFSQEAWGPKVLQLQGHSKYEATYEMLMGVMDGYKPEMVN